MSNGLENAFRAVSGLDEQQRTVSLYCGVRLNKLLLEIKNPYQGEIVMCEGLPVSDRAGHGYGCRSISALVRQHGGLCKFQAEDGIFCLQAAMPMNG